VLLRLTVITIAADPLVLRPQTRQGRNLSGALYCKKVVAEVSKIVAEALVEESISVQVPACSVLCNSSELTFSDTGFNVVAEACDSYFVNESDLANLNFEDHGSSLTDFDTNGNNYDTQNMEKVVASSAPALTRHAAIRQYYRPAFGHSFLTVTF